MDNSTIEAVVAFAIIAIAAGSYFAGYGRGYRIGREDERNTETGWMEEARWWRRNATSIRTETTRDHSAED